MSDNQFLLLQEQASLAEKEFRWQDAEDIYNKMISLITSSPSNQQLGVSASNEGKLSLIRQQRDACSFHSFIRLAQDEFAPGAFSELIRNNGGNKNNNSNMIPTQSNRERRQPDDVRLELFVPYYHQSNNINNSSNTNKLISDEIVRRFRSWKTKYFQLIRAIEWCLPDQDALVRTVQRVRSYGKDRYSKFFELDGSCLECAQALSCNKNNNNSNSSNAWNEIISEKFLATRSSKQDGTDSSASCCCRHKNNDNVVLNIDDADGAQQQQQQSQIAPPSSPPVFGLALLVVFGSAADPLMIASTNNNYDNVSNNNNLGPKVPTSSSAATSSAEQQRQEIYEKKKKIKVDNIGGGNNNNKKNSNNNKLSFFKTVDSTSRSLKGFLINNITDPDIIDILIQRHLLKLIIQMKIQSKIIPVVTHNASDSYCCPSTLLRAFVPMIYEPVRRCSSVLALGDTIFVMEPFLYARDGIFSCLRDLLRSSVAFSKIYLLVLGDVRDAVLMSKADVEFFVATCATSQQRRIEVEWICNNENNTNSSKIQKFEFVASSTNKVNDDDDDVVGNKNISQSRAGLTFTIQHFDYGLSVACLQSFSLTASPKHYDQDEFSLISFTGDFLSLDSYVKQLFNNNSVGVPQQKFLSGVLSTYQQQLEFEANVAKKKQQNQEAGENYYIDENIVVTNDTLLFPSHGGYSWITHQLDLSWAGFAYLTNKSLFFSSSSSSSNAPTTTENPNSVPKIVAGGLHQLIWRRNQEIISSPTSHNNNNSNSSIEKSSFEDHVQDLLAKTTLSPASDTSNIATTKFLSFFQTTSVASASASTATSPGRAMFDPSVPLIVDTRSPDEYEELRIAGSLSIPFALEEPAKSSKKAELWLSQLAPVPGQKLILVLPQGHETEVLKRVCCILPLSSSSNNGNNNSNTTIELLACLIVGKLEAGNVLERLSAATTIKLVRGKSSFFSTASSYEEVADILSRSNSDDKNNQNNHFVIDCRTPIEFAQGSHIEAANIPLADFRFWLMMMMMMMMIANRRNVNNNDDLPFDLVNDIKDWISSTKSSSRGSNPEKMKFLPSRKELFTNFHSFRDVTTEEEDLLRGVYVGFHKSEVPCFEYLVSKIFSDNDSNIIDHQSCDEVTAEKEERKNTTLLIYCAGGYRSRIFMSIFEAVMLTVDIDSASVRVCDVGRGAVELMSQHAERWTVKDRGIVCVS